MATATNLFQIKNGKSFEDVKALIGSEYTVKRCTHNTKKFIMTAKDGSERYFGFKPTMGELYTIIEKKGLEGFLKEYGLANVDPVKGTVIAKIQQKKEKKEKIIKACTARQVSKTNKKLIEEIQLKKMEVTVQIMNFKIKRGSAEHLKLRKQLDEYNTQLKSLDGHEDWETTKLRMTAEEMSKARATGIAKKKARLEKKKAIKNKQVRIKGC